MMPGSAVRQYYWAAEKLDFHCSIWLSHVFACRVKEHMIHGRRGCISQRAASSVSPGSGSWQLLKTQSAITISGTYEENISTQQYKEETYSRLSCADAYKSGSRHPQRPPAQRQSSINPLIVLSPRHSEGFGREYRLRKAVEYKHVLGKQAKSDKVVTQPFIFYAHDNTYNTARLGIAVASRFLKRAVQRNRVKRMVRDSFRKNRHRLPARDYVVIYKAGQPPPFPRCHEALKFFWDKQAQGAQ